MRKTLALAGMLAWLTSPVLAQTNGDQQFWNTMGFESRFSDQWKMAGELEMRDSTLLSDRYYFHGDLGFNRSLSDSLSTGLAIRYVYEQRGGAWEQEQRPHGHLTYKTTLGGWSLQERNRLELRTFEESDTHIRYRNRLTLVAPWRFTQYRLQPFIADELFINVNAGELNRNRLYLGVKTRPARRFKVDVYYLWQSSKKTDHWKDYHAIGLKAKVSL